MNRRDLFKMWIAAGAFLSSQAKNAASVDNPRIDAGRSPSAQSRTPTVQGDSSTPLEAEFIVVGSGAGGGTLAARLAEKGYTVLLLEAGSDAKPPGSSEGDVDVQDYDVPGFHARATENETMRWDFWVRHYADDMRQKRDPKYYERWEDKPVDGVWYPRSGTLGGCTAHNALILVYPHDSDWNQLADATGDPTWRADHMRTYFERIENCHHRRFDRALSKLGINRGRHGFGGWLHTERAFPREALRDRDLRRVLVDSARAALTDSAGRSKFRLGVLSNDEGDPNDARVTGDNAVGVRYTPLTTHEHMRIGARERVLDIAKRFPRQLRIVTNALVTKVVFDTSKRATGVEFLAGERLYRAHARPNTAAGVRRQAFASREVILAGGAFNTPQLLMLSGIGPRDQISRTPAEMVMEIPGVGKNLQDRYEVAVVNRMSFPTWSVLDGATFTDRDRQYAAWKSHREGVYASNGAALSVVLRSSLDRVDPDLFLYALVGYFRGYEPRYSLKLPENPNVLTWVVLKGHTNNTSGEVTLRSPDPLDPPRVNFHYFEESNDALGADLQSVVDGVEFVRKMVAPLKEQKLVKEEEVPGDKYRTSDQLKDFIRDNAWGHHASCTCKIGPIEQGGVLSSDFKVHGTQGLRVVDASVFPRIPGLFIASAVYMIGEKAADVIMADAKRNVPPRRARQP